MKQHLFALTRSEQRVVVLIMLLLVGGVAAKRYHDLRTRPLIQPSTFLPEGAPSASPTEDETGPVD